MARILPKRLPLRLERLRGQGNDMASMRQFPPNTTRVSRPLRHDTHHDTHKACGVSRRLARLGAGMRSVRMGVRWSAFVADAQAETFLEAESSNVGSLTGRFAGNLTKRQECLIIQVRG